MFVTAWEQQKFRPACPSTQSDQCVFINSLENTVATCKIPVFKLDSVAKQACLSITRMENSRLACKTGQLAARQQNTIRMVFRWRDDSGLWWDAGWDVYLLYLWL